jgi:hypothetical protein
MPTTKETGPQGCRPLSVKGTGEMPKLVATYVDDQGNSIVINGESHEEMAAELPADFVGSLNVYDEHGFKRGRIGRLQEGSVDWSAV